MIKINDFIFGIALGAVAASCVWAAVAVAVLV
jgi:hypothetical protein